MLRRVKKYFSTDRNLLDERIHNGEAVKRLIHIKSSPEFQAYYKDLYMLSYPQPLPAWIRRGHFRAYLELELFSAIVESVKQRKLHYQIPQSFLAPIKSKSIKLNNRCDLMIPENLYNSIEGVVLAHSLNRYDSEL